MDSDPQFKLKSVSLLPLVDVCYCGMLRAQGFGSTLHSAGDVCSVQFLCGVLSAVCGMLSVVSLWHAQCSFFAACSVQFLC